MWTSSLFFLSFIITFFFLLHFELVDLFEMRLFGFINGVHDTYGERFLTMTGSYLPCLFSLVSQVVFSYCRIDFPKKKKGRETWKNVRHALKMRNWTACVGRVFMFILNRELRFFFFCTCT